MNTCEECGCEFDPGPKPRRKLCDDCEKKAIENVQKDMQANEMVCPHCGVITQPKIGMFKFKNCHSCGRPLDQ